MEFGSHLRDTNIWFSRKEIMRESISSALGVTCLEGRNDYIPEHELLTSMLERALRDLSTPIKEDISAKLMHMKSSIDWFDGINEDITILSYKYVCEQLKFSAKFVARVATVVNRTRKYYDQFKEERKSCGTRDSASTDGDPWNIVPEESTILRDGVVCGFAARRYYTTNRRYSH